MLACLGRSLRAAAAPCRWARTQFSISLEEFPAELAVARLNRKVQRAGLMTKWRRRAAVSLLCGFYCALSGRRKRLVAQAQANYVADC